MPSGQKVINKCLEPPPVTRKFHDAKVQLREATHQLLFEFQMDKKQLENGKAVRDWLLIKEIRMRCLHQLLLQPLLSPKLLLLPNLLLLLKLLIQLKLLQPLLLQLKLLLLLKIHLRKQVTHQALPTIQMRLIPPSQRALRRRAMPHHCSRRGIRLGR